jgi:hypothetical protein
VTQDRLELADNRNLSRHPLGPVLRANQSQHLPVILDQTEDDVDIVGLCGSAALTLAVALALVVQPQHGDSSGLENAPGVPVEVSVRVGLVLGARDARAIVSITTTSTP